MGKNINFKRGLKRHKSQKKFKLNKNLKKDDLVEHASLSGDLLEDQCNETVSGSGYVEPSVYDNLLATLHSCGDSLPDKKRQRKEKVLSDLSEDEAEDVEDPSSSGEDTGEEDDNEEENDEKTNNQGPNIPSSLVSSFHSHMDHKLSETEVNDLSAKKWKYKWDYPAPSLSNCKWLGTEECFLKDVNQNSGYGLKQKLYKHWLDVYKTSGGHDFDSSRQRFFFSLCNSYRDILHCNKKPFYVKGSDQDSGTMDGYIIHSLNHIFRSRDLVTKNDSKVAKQQEISKDEFLTDDGFLDRGFTRPKVMILLPFRNFAFRVLKRLIQLTPTAYKANVESMDRFVKDFGTQNDEHDTDDDEPTQTDRNLKSKKPLDHQALFSGNYGDKSDNFAVGIKFTRKSIKLFNDFHSSDLIVASPLGLLHNFGQAEKDKEKDVDYLSSIEILIIDHADVITMQNWDTLRSIVEQLNSLPLKQHGTDIFRIRKWYLEGSAKYYRQNIILSYYLNPDISALFNRQCLNYEGKLKLACEYKGVLTKVLPEVRQIYERFDASSVADADDARFDYFIKKVFPKIKDPDQGGVMLFISSYFEYIQLRNFLKSQNASVCLVGDYSEQSDISRARLGFFEGKKKIMLYTERRHFYSRYKIRGVKNLIIYSLPERKEFYPEVVNMLKDAPEMTCSVLFCRFDQLRLERIVGTASAKRMIGSEKGVFLSC